MKLPNPYNLFMKCSIFLCFFFYLYPIQFKILPVSNRIILSVLGLTVLLFTAVKQSYSDKDIYIKRYFLQYTFIFFLIMFVSLVSVFFNGSSDLTFFWHPLSIVFIMLGAAFIHFLLKKIYKPLTYNIVMKYMVAVVLCQVILSLISFLSPPVSTFLNSIQNISDLDVSKLEASTQFRLNGFGSTFFGAGIINGFTLLVIAVLLKQKTSRFKTFLLTLAFLIIFVLGMMMARTTIIGLILALVYFFMPSLRINKTVIKTRLRFFSNLLIIFVLSIALISLISPATRDLIQSAANFGFEMFNNYFEKGSLESASTNDLKTMYVFPTNFKTYFIGDGQYYTNPGDPSSSYYMGTDVGFLRLIYYFGITGTICFFLLEFAVIKKAISLNRSQKGLKFFFLLSFLFCLILNLKGFTDTFFLITLFVFDSDEIDETITQPTAITLSNA